jgi:hypothetical protein
MNGVYEVEVKKPNLLPYHTAASELARTFEYFNIEHVPRGQNTKADALASLALLCLYQKRRIHDGYGL